GCADQGDLQEAGDSEEHGALSVGLIRAAEVQASPEGIASRCVRTGDPQTSGGVPDDAGHGDRRADRLAALDDRAQGPSASDPPRVPRGRPGGPDRAQARRYDAVRSVVPEDADPARWWRSERS